MNIIAKKGLKHNLQYDLKKIINNYYNNNYLEI